MLPRKFTQAFVDKLLKVRKNGTLDMESGASIRVVSPQTGAATATISTDELARLDHSTSVETVSATNVITAAETGKTFFLSSGTEFVSTLPAAAAGLRFTFIVAAAPSGASYTIVTDSSANIIKGQVYSSDLNAASDGDIETSGGDTITLVDAKAVAGDRVEVICDGTNWFAYCFCSVFDAITITTAS